MQHPTSLPPNSLYCIAYTCYNHAAFPKVPLVDKKSRVLTGTLLLLLLSCAGQVPPEGGPPDTTPPEIIRTSPDTNAVRVTDNSVLLEFSKYVDRRTLQESIFISPYVGALEFDWSGKEVAIRFEHELRPTTTYVVTVGTDVRDIRAGNRMANAFTLAFSTGDSIDHGLITGRVFDEKPAGVMIYAFGLSRHNKDSLDPSKVGPDYITQTGTNGEFRLSNIAYDTYRLLAIRDELRNFRYNRQVDDYGVATHDVEIGPSGASVGGIGFRMTREDTTSPFVTAARAIDDRQVFVRFSEPLDSTTFGASQVVIRDTLTRGTIGVSMHFLDHSNATVGCVVTAMPLARNTAYLLRVDNVFDRAGNRIDTSNATAMFEIPEVFDTTRPQVSLGLLQDSVRGRPLEDPVVIRFDKPVESDPLAAAVSILDSASAKVPVQLTWVHPMELRVAPITPLAGKAWYGLDIVMDSLRDLRGNTYRDSTLRVRFETLDLRTEGIIEGAVSLPPTSPRGPVVLVVTGLDTRPPRRRSIELGDKREFTIDRLVEGRYTLEAFVDADSSGTYTFGLPFPFVPSEPFAVYPDTVKVRARWSVEGVNINFR